MRKIHADRLLVLAAFLEKLPPDRFDFGQWVGADWKGSPDLSCGTTACALGWATTIPRFRRMGLRLYKKRFSEAFIGFNFEFGVKIVGKRMGSYNYEHERYAARRIFGVDSYGFERLFLPGEIHDRATPREAARNIKRFVHEERQS